MTASSIRRECSADAYGEEEKALRVPVGPGRREGLRVPMGDVLEGEKSLKVLVGEVLKELKL